MTEITTISIAPNEWTALADADLTEVTFQNQGMSDILFKGTADTAPPTSASASIRYAPGQGERGTAMSDLFPGIVALRAWAFCESGARLIFSGESVPPIEKAFVGKLAVSAADVASLSASFANLTDAAGDSTSIASGMVAIIAVSADKGGTGESLTITGFDRLGASPDANPVSAVFTRELDGTETSISFVDATAGSVQDVSVSIAVFEGIEKPTSAERSTGTGLGDPEDINVTNTSQMVIATGHIDDIEVNDLGPPTGMTLAVASVYSGGAENSSTTGIAYDLDPGVGAYNPVEFTGTGSDSDDAYIMLAEQKVNGGAWVTDDYDNATFFDNLGDGLRWNINGGYDESGNQQTDNEHAFQRGVGTYSGLYKFEIRGGESASSDSGDQRGRAELSGSSQDPLEWASEGVTPTECWFYVPVIFEALDGQAGWETFAQIYGMLSLDNAHIQNPIVKFERMNDGTVEINVGGATGITAGNASTLDDRVTVWKSNEDIVEGRIYRWLVRFVPNGAGGELTVWLNGTQIFTDSDIPIGWGERTRTYAKFGIYRDEDDLASVDDYGTSTFIYHIPEQASGSDALLSYVTTPPAFPFYGAIRADGVLTGAAL